MKEGKTRLRPLFGSVFNLIFQSLMRGFVLAKSEVAKLSLRTPKI
jgi:hypothetical protein